MMLVVIGRLCREDTTDLFCVLLMMIIFSFSYVSFLKEIV